MQARSNEIGSVYWNSHQRLYSVRNRPEGRVVARVKALVVFDARFVVRQKGRTRALRLGHKTQHADVRGRVELIDSSADVRGWTLVTYSHELNSTFVSLDDGRPVVAAEEVRMRTVGGRPWVYARGITYG